MDSGYAFDYRRLEQVAAPQKDFCKNIQAYLEERKDQITGVQILNGPFMEVCFAPFFGLYSSNGPTLRYWGDGEEKLETTTYDSAAKFAAEIAMDKNAIGYQSVLGDRKSSKEIAAAIESEYGTHLKMERLGSLEDLYETMKTAMAENPQNMYAWTGMNCYYHGLNGSTYLPTHLDADRYPEIKATKLEDMLKQYSLESLNNAYMF